MNVIKLSVAAALLLTATTTVKAQTAEEIMEKHEKAIGGVDNWNKIKTLKMTGSMSMQGMEIGITQTLALGKAMRMDISVMGMTGYQIVTTKEGWAYMPMQGSTKVDTMKPDMVKAAQPQLDIKNNQFLDYKKDGTKLHFEGIDTVNNVACYKVKLTKDDKESIAYFEKATYYLLRTETKAKVDDQEQEVAMAYSNYQKVDGGVVMPMSMTIMGGELTFKSIELNKPVDEKIFRPTTN